MSTITAALPELHLSSPPAQGPAVSDVQQRLSELGYSVGEIDGIYGVATATAVRAFQSDHGLDADGVVGPLTRAALASTKGGRAHESSLPGSIGARALAEAVKHIGTKESPPSSNRTAFGQWFGVDGVAWCNIFVSYCFAVGAGTTLCDGFKGAGVYAKGCTYVPTTEAWLRATGQWRGRVRPQPGDIAIYNWDGGVPDHIGIVERDLGDGTFLAIEGNTAAGNDSDGGAVMRRTRRLSQVDGFGRVG
jgi:hypothetical protein